MEKCRICEREFKNRCALFTHIAERHKLKTKEYYDTYLKQESEGKCLTCGKPTKFLGTAKGYCDFCCVKCARNNERTKERLRNTLLEKYGVETGFDCKEIRDKAKNTLIERYGVDNPLKIEAVKEKVKQTNLARYGTEHAFQSDAVKEKIKKTNLERYGVEHNFQSEEIKKKMKETWLRKYGVEYPTQSRVIQEKIQNTCLKRYGVKSVFHSKEIREKIQQTLLDRYGVNCTFASEIVKEKIKATFLEKYGSPYASSAEVVKNKAKETMLKKYGVTCIFQRPDIREKALSQEAHEKCYCTKKKNNTFPTSKIEKELEIELRKLFPDLQTQYKSKLYPFACDFYIPSRDLYIEYNGTWMHGDHFFDVNNQEDIEKLNQWTEKSKTSTYYRSAVHIWTNRDVLRLTTAIQNNLNYVAWFTKEQAYDWIASQRY